jgi:hypothetical protein
VGPDGAGVADVEVRASFDEGSRAATSRADGSFTITGLHAGTSYSLWVSSARWQVRASPVVAAPATGVTVPVTGRLFMGGRVVDTDGQPLRGAIVRVPSGDGSWWSTSTDEDGSFYLGDVPDGEYAVHVDRHGDGNAVECGTLRAGVIGAEIRYPGR